MSFRNKRAFRKVKRAERLGEQHVQKTTARLKVKAGDVLHHTLPHHAQEVVLVEDQRRVPNRIYEVKDDSGGRVGFLGSELGDLAKWWPRERKRRGHDSDADPGAAFRGGWEDALNQIDFVLKQGGTIEDGIKAHKAFREVGDRLTPDPRSFDAGASAAYRAARRHFPPPTANSIMRELRRRKLDSDKIADAITDCADPVTDALDVAALKSRLSAEGRLSAGVQRVLDGHLPKRGGAA